MAAPFEIAQTQPKDVSSINESLNNTSTLQHYSFNAFTQGQGQLDAAKRKSATANEVNLGTLPPATFEQVDTSDKSHQEKREPFPRPSPERPYPVPPTLPPEVPALPAPPEPAAPGEQPERPVEESPAVEPQELPPENEPESIKPKV